MESILNECVKMKCFYDTLEQQAAIMASLWQARANINFM